MNQPKLPPILSSVPTDAADPFVEACARAAELGAGAMVWARRTDRFDCAVVLEPEAPTEQAVSVFHAAMLALGDALGALAPPTKPVQFGYPDRIVIDGACAGGLRIAVGPEVEGVPAWLVIGARLAIEGGGGEPGHTALHDEGFVGVTGTDLLEHYARHLLSWIDRWQDEGYGPIRLQWMSRLEDARSVPVTFQASDAPLTEPVTEPGATR